MGAKLPRCHDLCVVWTTNSWHPRGGLEQVEPALELARLAALVVYHDALVVTDAGGDADWPKSLDPTCPDPSDVPSLCDPLLAWGCAFAVPAPQRGVVPACHLDGQPTRYGGRCGE
jgi:hypothetical protein